MKKLLTNKLGLKIIALGLAVLIWAYINWPLISNYLKNLIKKDTVELSTPIQQVQK